MAAERSPRPSTDAAPARRVALLGLVAATLCGCVPSPDSGPVATVTASDRRIAADLVGVLARVEAVAPGDAPAVHVVEEPGERAFARALEIALLEAGYEVVGRGARAARRRAGEPIGYAVLRGLDGGTLTATYTVAFGDVGARRDWSLSPGTRGAPGARWTPVGPLFVRGADVATLAPVAPVAPPR